VTSLRSRTLLAVLLAFAGMAAPAAARPRQAGVPAAAAPIVGIADQKPDFLSDPRFLALHLTHARVSVAWDALKSPWQTAELDTWLAAARADGVEPLVTFDRSRLPGLGRKLPSVARYAAQFRAFRQRYPWIHDFSTWNEANYCGQETCRNPELVARYYRALKLACPSCRILAADILDLPSMAVWIKRFMKVAGQPRYWGFHNYVTANRFQVQRTKALLSLVKGEVWFTETGGLVARRNKSLIKLPQGTQHAAQVTRFILRTLAALSPRITRIYLYHWDSQTSKDSWDSGLVSSDGHARPALGVLQTILKSSPLRRR